MQRKLTDDELNIVIEVRARMTRIMAFAREAVIISQALPALDGMATHATTDGKPCVEPEPPIPDGYRRAVKGDEGRSDCKYWSNLEPKWCVRAASGVGQPFADSYRYIVPVDRTPTDDDAKSRPVVMVRDHDTQDWTKRILLGVLAIAHHRFVTTCSEEIGSNCWKHCRFPYSNETP